MRPGARSIRAVVWGAVAMASIRAAGIAAALGPAAAAAGAPARVVDWSDWARVLRAVDSRGRVDYATLVRERARLDAVVEAIARAPREALEAAPRAERMAFHLNAYNALVLRLVVDHWPPDPGENAAWPARSIRNIPGAFDGVRFTVAGEAMTLDHLENAVIRPAYRDPRVHAALVCAARSCPPLRATPFTADSLEAQLDDQARRFVRDPSHVRVDAAAGVVHLSPIFDWFADDFAAFAPDRRTPPDVPERLAGVARFLVAYLPEGPAREAVAHGGWRAEWLEYDWTINDVDR